MFYWKASNLEYLPALGSLSFVTCWSGPLCNLYISTFDGKLGPGAREAAGCDAFSIDRMLFHVTSCYIYMDIRGYNMALRFWYVLMFSNALCSNLKKKGRDHGHGQTTPPLCGDFSSPDRSALNRFLLVPIILVFFLSSELYMKMSSSALPQIACKYY